VKLGEVPKIAAAKTPDPSEQPFSRNFDLKNLPDMDELLPKGFGESPKDNGDVKPLREGRARLGVGVGSLTDAIRKEYKIPAGVKGAVVTSVEDGSVAAKLGLEPGDVIERLGDTQILAGEDLVKAMEGVKWGDTKALKWGRYSDGAQFVQTRPVKFE
jgi:hypothetical protein